MPSAALAALHCGRHPSIGIPSWTDYWLYRQRRRTSDHFSCRVVGASGVDRGAALLRDTGARRDGNAPSSVSFSVAAVEQEHLGAAVSRAIPRVSAPAARHQALSNGGAQRERGRRGKWPAFVRAQGHSSVALVSGCVAGTVIHDRGSGSPARRFWVIHASGVWRTSCPGHGSFGRLYNTRLKPARPAMCAIMSPRRAA